MYVNLYVYSVVSLVGSLGWSLPASAHILTPDFEVQLLDNVGASWQTIPLDNSYSNAVVVCTYNLPSISSPPATTRVRNVTANSFQLRIQQFENNNTVTANTVHCIIVDEGSYNIGGLKFEAHTVLSTGTSGSRVPGGWNSSTTQEVTTAISQSYANPVVLGQVMSFNDVKASVFWTNNCANRGHTPFVSNNRICVGKHIGMINNSRANETIGYIVAEAGSGTRNDMKYALDLGPSTIAGTANSAPYTYTLNDNYDIGIATQNAENGGNGGWAVLYGSDPLPANALHLAIEEEVVAGDTSRGHIGENVAYWVFKDSQSVNLSSSKTVTMSSTSVSPYAIPGSDVLYKFSVENTGSKPVDLDSIVIIDALPSEAIFYNGDIDDGGPETGTVIFTDTGSGLSFTPSTDLAFSSAATKPANFAACTYTPSAGYDPAVSYICLNPKGKLNAGSLASSSFTLSFRTQVK